MFIEIRRLVVTTAATLVLSMPAFTQGHQEKRGANVEQAASPSTPGAPQEFLAKRAGEYSRAIKFLGQPGEWTGTSKISVILGGRFLLEENHDTVFDRPVEGMRIFGYNNATKQYEMVSMYTMSTAITKLIGTSVDGGKTVEYAGTSDEPRGKVPLHAQVRQIDDDHFVVTLSSTGPDGQDMPFQETTYTRKK
jgi:Protein of unknown function (DUF1579)